ncbi:MAG: DUF6263 family protein [Polyangiaceae bacterium]
MTTSLRRAFVPVLFAATVAGCVTSKRPDDGGTLQAAATTTSVADPVPTNPPMEGASAGTEGGERRVRLAERTSRLMDAGAEPRKALRHRYTKGREESLDVTIAIRTSTQTDALDDAGTDGGSPEPKVRALPVVVARTFVEVTDVLPSGDAAFAMEIDAFDVRSDKDVAPELVDAVRAGLAGAKGVRATGVATPRGERKDVTLVVPPLTSREAQQVLENFRQQIEQLGVVLPEEPVGKGATWEVTNDVATRSIVLTQATTFTLASADDKAVRIVGTLRQSAPAQDVTSPVTGGSSNAKLESLTGSGKVESTTSPGSLAPLVSTALRTNLVLAVPLQGRTVKSSITTSAKIDTAAGGRTRSKTK